MADSKDRVSFQIDGETREAFRELKSKYGLNISAFLRNYLLEKYKEMKIMEAEYPRLFGKKEEE